LQQSVSGKIHDSGEKIPSNIKAWQYRDLVPASPTKASGKSGPNCLQIKRAHRLASPFTIYSLVSYRQTKIVGQLAQEGIDKGKANKANHQT